MILKMCSKREMSSAKDIGLWLSSRMACVASSAVASSMRSRFVNLSFQWNGERDGGESGVKRSG